MFNRKDFDDLVNVGVANRKDFGRYSVFKYKRKVFYEDLWRDYPMLTECRGIVFAGNRVVQLPFTKAFYDGQGFEIDDNKPVIAARKVNGFMFAVTYDDVEKRFVYSTTGSIGFDNDHIRMGLSQLVCPKLIDYIQSRPVYTFLFEVCVDGDIHPIQEKQGLHILGIRSKATGVMQHPMQLSKLQFDNVHYPATFYATFGELKESMRSVKHEGYVVYDMVNYTVLCKMKSDYYRTRKYLMRLSDSYVDLMVENQDEFTESISTDTESYSDLVDFLVMTYGKGWKEMGELERRDALDFYEKVWSR